MLTEWMIHGALAACLSYFLGSIPTAVWTGRVFFKIDVRDHGSGNAGATNTFRVLGKKAGVFVLLVDILKGVAAVLLASAIMARTENPFKEEDIRISAAIIAVLGHVYPVFAGFRGGKGVATVLGAVIAVKPEAAGICLGVFVIVFLLSNYVSLSSMLASVCFPLLLFIIWPVESVLLKTLSVLIPIFIIYTHRANVVKLLKGTESKIYLLKTRNK